MQTHRTDTTFRHEARPGNLPLSLFTLVGLILLAAQLWQIMPGVVMLVVFPALLACIVQLALTPVYRLHMTDSVWRFETEREIHDLPAAAIAFLKVEEGHAQTRGIVVMSDGSEVELPRYTMPDPLVLIREATRRGIPVRHGRA